MSASSMVRPVTPTEIENYRRDGWVHLPGLVSAEVVAKMRTHLERRLGVDGLGMLDAPGAGNARLVDLVERRDIRFIARDEKQEPFAELCFASELGPNAQRLIGRPVPTRYFVDAVLAKIPETSGHPNVKTAWHQDFAFLPCDRAGFCVIWIALHDIPPERGSMRFISGSHRAGPLGRISHENGPDLLDRNPHLLTEFALSEPLHMAPGDATCHHSLMVHSAPVNTTDQVRWAYTVSYFPADTCYTGAPSTGTDGLNLRVGDEFDHPLFPIVADR